MNRYKFDLVDETGAVVGGGWVVAPGPGAARRTASLFLGGGSTVRLEGEGARE
ncbi:hypothetical protein SA2016_0849 [Sinomonas atrocyanea]|uniref:Uncharacterized protein n=1 Tax=Sinomonas atrocyanea TaxID=37927 RepID=A0A126ZX52_9MICC|nr:hypothetical protein [Sinomonas atrocyanea]AMM31537.1 hypothetical protein SA2016_0849 [Sinomonas atrocyanea]GEB66032.1 hypothetical protein SAT01_34800 [Sinomonas atrocyanea]GGG63448.1 hypothetical protein GCM10007172_13400 [Sinomonas atrocyanea]